ncbi:hypothetical protein RI845_12080 [Thalassotalea nanhaiensis]|uniref:Uncharacterized protein n=1 Tax=Thalassotalea nanhaiensis TaxID=3065648 RepID=A0ABY9TEX8_9GAMM|nr:hypothetical protein RI845_12080 [Colwelliaceae bacterium SQ345]
MNSLKWKNLYLELKFIDRFLLPICFIFILSGAANNGFTSFFFALPFVVLFCIRLLSYKKETRNAILIVTALVCIPLLPKEMNTLYYPNIGAEIQIDAAWGYAKYHDSEYLSLWKREFIESDSRADIKGRFTAPLTLRMTKVSASHPSMGVSLWPVFVDSNGVEYTISESSLLSSLKDGSIQSHDFSGVNNLQSRWTFFLGLLMSWPLIFILIL